MASAARAYSALLCLRLGFAIQSSSVRVQHQPREVLAAADALWGEAVPEEVPHAVVDDVELFDKVAIAVKAKIKATHPSSAGLAEQPADKRPEVVLYWKTLAMENGTKGTMKMNRGCTASSDGGTLCTVNFKEEGARDQPIHMRLKTGRSLREGDVLISSIQAHMATGDQQELKFACPACSFPCTIPLPGGHVQVQMPPCPILAGVYDLSVPLSIVPFMDTVQNMTASTYAMHADGRGAFNIVSFLKVKQHV